MKPGKSSSKRSTRAAASLLYDGRLACDGVGADADDDDDVQVIG